ncbi:hypothetical protein [Tardiphaga sp. 768_D3_N2_1]|uniref:hypothetical protein n=1 Tax=Tardiphaga sp. 768_D3_N2_1 TaxID=3240783 RepID=UPI003F8CD055
MAAGDGERAVSPVSLKEFQGGAGVFLLENIAAEISSMGKDNLGKPARKRRFIA